MPATCSRPAALCSRARAPSSRPTTPSVAATSGTDGMASAETAASAGFRARGGELAYAGAVTVFLVGGAIFLLVGCLQSTNFARLTVEGLAVGAVYSSLALALVLVYRASHVVNFAQGELA